MSEGRSEAARHPDPAIEARLARMRERAGREFPPHWKAENPGDEIAGELARYERGHSARGPRIIAVLRGPQGGERAVWLHETVLLDEFRRQRPKPGEFVLIRYEGRKESHAGAEYAHYRVVVDREDSMPDWDALDAGAPAGEIQTPAGQVGSGVHEPLEPEPGPETPRANPNDDDIPF